MTDLCQEYDATGLPIAISASGRPRITSTINVEQGGIITDINIKNLKGDHTFIYDLDFSLTSPNGTRVLLFSEACFGQTQNFNLNIDDSGIANNCQLTAGNTYLPVRSLAAFNGEEASGNWVLTVKDFFNLDGGSLDEWTLEICTVPESSDCNTSTSIVLATQDCAFDESFDLNLEDTGMALSCPLTGGNTYSPIGSLADFNSEIPTGDWVLTITDIDGFSEIVSCSSTIPQEETVAMNQRTPISKRPYINKTQWRRANINLEVSPNPFKQQTNIKYQLPNATPLSIQLRDINGKLVQEILPTSSQQAGIHQLILDATPFPTGVYFLQLQTNKRVLTKKLIIQQ